MGVNFDCIIVGAGIAGASVGWHLARMGAGRSVLVLERESAPGTHASAQNASIIRSLVAEESVSRLALEGVRFWMEPPAELGLSGVYRQVGGLLLTSEQASLDLLAMRAAGARERGFETEVWSADACVRAYPILADTPILGGVLARQDGVADPAAVIDAFLRETRRLGGEVRFDHEVTSIDVDRGRVTGVRCGDLRFSGDQVVLAAGAWVQDLMVKAGASDRGVVPFRRHIFCSTPTTVAARSMPFVWHADLGAYFREEAGGLLFSVCDEEAVAPGRPAVAPGIAEEADRKLTRVFPFLKELPVAHCWAGLRTFAADREFLLGPDPRIDGLHYAAALGGHGVTCAAPVGRIVAEAVARGA